MTCVLWRMQHGRAYPLDTLRAVVREPLPKLWLEAHFEPRDVWLGAYIADPRDDAAPGQFGWRHGVDLFICVVPMLPVKIMLRWQGARAAVRDARRAWQEWRYDDDS